MSKGMLIGTIVASVLAVGAIAAVTATVIAQDNDRSGRHRVVEFAAPAPGPGTSLPPGRGPRFFEPGRFGGRLGDMRKCLQQHGFPGPDRGTPPAPQKLMPALKACAPNFQLPQR